MRPPERVVSGWALSKTGNTKQYMGNILRDYKLDTASFNRIWAEQGGVCGICKLQLAHPIQTQHPSGARCVIDHWHKKDEAIGSVQPEQVRGLLCKNCNDLLGAVRESIHTLENAATWLKERGVSEWDHEESPVAKPTDRWDEMEVTELDGTKKTVRRYY